MTRIKYRTIKSRTRYNDIPHGKKKAAARTRTERTQPGRSGSTGARPDPERVTYSAHVSGVMHMIPGPHICPDPRKNRHVYGSFDKSRTGRKPRSRHERACRPAHGRAAAFTQEHGNHHDLVDGSQKRQGHKSSYGRSPL